MSRLVLGAAGALACTGIAGFWMQGRAAVEEGAPPPAVELTALNTEADMTIPVAADTSLVGPAPPEASELSKEQRRFFQYDRDRDWKISRNEMLSSRTKAFRKLDKDGNNLLSFEEWAVATVDKFDKADRDGNLYLTPSEFVSTRSRK